MSLTATCTQPSELKLQATFVLSSAHTYPSILLIAHRVLSEG